MHAEFIILHIWDAGLKVLYLSDTVQMNHCTTLGHVFNHMKSWVEKVQINTVQSWQLQKCDLHSFNAVAVIRFWVKTHRSLSYIPDNLQAYKSVGTAESNDQVHT